MRRFVSLAGFVIALTAPLTGCLRRTEVLEPTPCLPEPPSGRSALAWTQTNEKPNTIYGRVMELRTEALLTYAEVGVSSKSFHLEPRPVTAAGSFSFVVPSSGQYDVRVRALGFELARAIVDVRDSLGTQILATMAPSRVTFDGCGFLAPVRRWRFRFP